METFNYNGYTNSNVNLDNTQSLTFKDVGTMQYVWLGVELSLTQYMRKTKHNTWHRFLD